MLEGRARALPFSLCACRAGLRGLCDAGAVTTGGSLRTSEPIFNVPTVVSATIALLVLIHAARAWVLTQEQAIELLLLFSFIPARYDATVLAQGAVPGGIGAEIWSFVTYALIHGDWVHLGINSVWLLGIGSLSLDGGEQAVAWQAHIGGFVAGLLAFAAFDPVRPPVMANEPDQPTIH